MSERWEIEDQVVMIVDVVLSDDDVERELVVAHLGDRVMDQVVVSTFDPIQGHDAGYRDGEGLVVCSHRLGRAERHLPDDV